MTASSGDDVSQESEPTVIHVDMDAFYASVEVLQDPSLVGKPVLVGGTGPRGVVAAASYEARVFGVRSAMPMSTARRLCPTAEVLSGDHTLYRRVSERIMSVFADVTPLVEPLSLDEAFLDVASAQALFGSSRQIAHQIRQRILEQEGLRCSVGVARTKHVAKLASNAAKPWIEGRRIVPGPGVYVVTAENERSFLRPLPIRAMWGVGPKTADRLARLGVTTVGEVADLDVGTVVACLGEANGRHIHALANGHDDRAVEADRPTKSISQETTFPYDLTNVADARSQLVALADSVATRLRDGELFGKTVSIKVRLGSFRTVTRAKTLPDATATSGEIAATARALFDDLESEQRVMEQGVRLLGVAASGLTAVRHRQLSLGLLGPDDGPRPSPSHSDVARVTGRQPADDLDGAMDAAVDAIRSKFGSTSIGRGGLRPGGDGAQNS